MAAWWSGSVAEFLRCPAAEIVGQLATRLVKSHSLNQPQQERAWQRDVALLKDALAAVPSEWRVLLEYPMLRLGRRIDAVLLTDRAILVLEFKGEATTPQDRRQVEDYACDLVDFHAGSRTHPIVPILVSSSVPRNADWPLLWHAVTPVLEASAATLANILRDVMAAIPAPAQPLDVAAWENSPYRPVPSVIDAACTLYARHDVEDIAAAAADTTNLSTTTQKILKTIQESKAAHQKTIIFVTGIPGAGKTLCGLNVVFGTGHETGAAFLTGNPSLVHVLREALARDAAADRPRAMGAERRKTKALIQALPAFRDQYIGNMDHIPPERIIVVDEAQRAWSMVHAVRKSRDRTVALEDSEPGLILDIMARHSAWAVIVCLVGGGQEIHNGEGGLAEWGVALKQRPEWKVIAAPNALALAPARQYLPKIDTTEIAAELHLNVSVRNVRARGAAAWVDAVIRGEAIAAARIAAREKIPFLLTRNLASMRSYLRTSCQGNRRAGLIGSSGAARLRADGIGAELPHMDASLVARWFLDRWPQDVRASDALEVLATEFSCQGLELDYVGLCWGGDLMRASGQHEWGIRNFRGTKWQRVGQPEARENRLNTYRVLLTRARYETIIWVPHGDATDDTRKPRELQAIADFLSACGARPLDAAAFAPVQEQPEALLL